MSNSLAFSVTACVLVLSFAAGASANDRCHGVSVPSTADADLTRISECICDVIEVPPASLYPISCVSLQHTLTLSYLKTIGCIKVAPKGARSDDENSQTMVGFNMRHYPHKSEDEIMREACNSAAWVDPTSGCIMVNSSDNVWKVHLPAHVDFWETYKKMLLTEEAEHSMQHTQLSRQYNPSPGAYDNDRSTAQVATFAFLGYKEVAAKVKAINQGLKILEEQDNLGLEYLVRFFTADAIRKYSKAMCQYIKVLENFVENNADFKAKGSSNPSIQADIDKMLNCLKKGRKLKADLESKLEPFLGRP